jgi:hypothetical protein
MGDRAGCFHTWLVERLRSPGAEQASKAVIRSRSIRFLACPAVIGGASALSGSLAGLLGPQPLMTDGTRGGPSLLVPERLHRLEVRGALGGVEAKEQPDRR